MHSLHLLVGIALGLCFVMPPLVQSVCLELNEEDIDELLFYHNAIRAGVVPPAANMRQMVWSDELAQLAAVNACACNYQPANLPPIPYKNHFARENHQVFLANDLGLMVGAWYVEHLFYDFSTPQCNAPVGATCEHYLNIIWARACEVGCALSVCRPEDLDVFPFPNQDPNSGADGQGTLVPEYLFQLVCVYGAGFPEEDDLSSIRPYWAGEPCSECPMDRFPLCRNVTIESPFPPLELIFSESQRGEPVPHTQLPNLCYNEDEACIGSDPHFAIRLSGGALLCYSFQGQPNTIFNLVSNDQLRMNALFVPDNTDYDNTWLGSIGITVRHNGKKMTTLQFTADDQLVRIGERVEFEAKVIKKLSFQDGEMTMLEVPSNHTPRYPRIHVEFIDSGLQFTIRYAKSNHLDLDWHNTRVSSKKSGGIVGQFFHDRVRIDEDAKFLLVPGRPPVPVEEQDLWKFTKQNFHGYSKCWASAYHSSQGAGIVAGTFQDYIVEDLLSVGH